MLTTTATLALAWLLLLPLLFLPLSSAQLACAAGTCAACPLLQRMGEADNFWAAGPTGPCGPCSELYYDFHPERGTAGADLEDERFIEFYNLVFMERERER